MTEISTQARAERSTDVLIIGGGPGGYVCGIRAAQLGLGVIIVDRQPPGGTCLNVGCIPSKAIIHAADEFAAAASKASPAGHLGIHAGAPTLTMTETMAWKDSIVGRLNKGVAGLLAAAGAEWIDGSATLVDGKSADIETADSTFRINADHLVLATGSAPIEISLLPFSDRVLSSTEALALTEVPQRLAVVGGGYIGLELGIAWAKLGSRVTIVEALDRVLAQYDKRLTRLVERSLASLDIKVLTSTRAIEDGGSGLVVEDDDKGRRVIPADKILVTVGRRPTTTGFGLDALGLAMDGDAVAVDARCATSMRNVWAIGDLTGEPMLAHRAMKQGEVAAEAIAGKTSAFDPTAIPAIVFTDPEIVSVGLGPDEAASQHGSIVEGRFMLASNGRTMTLDASAGFIRVLARAEDHLVVGMQAVGQQVSELSAAMALAIEMGARLEDLGDTIFAHPTVGEGVTEAAMTALGHGLHG